MARPNPSVEATRRKRRTPQLECYALKTLIIATALVLSGILSGCSSISCNYGSPDSTDQLPSDLPIGMTLQSRQPLIGLLDESIDDPSVHYLNITTPPGYQNRFVKQRIAIPANSNFKILGYRRPFNPLCRSHDWVLVISSKAQFTPDRNQIHMSVPLARNTTLITR